MLTSCCGVQIMREQAATCLSILVLERLHLSCDSEIGRCMVLCGIWMSSESGVTKLASCFLCSALDVDQKTKDLGGVAHFKGHSHITHIFIYYSPAFLTCCSLSDSNAAGARSR